MVLCDNYLCQMFAEHVGTREVLAITVMMMMISTYTQYSVGVSSLMIYFKVKIILIHISDEHT